MVAARAHAPVEPTARRQAEASGPAASTTAAPEGGLALYVHWPFCLSKCPYCDFNSVVREGIDEARWRAALAREIDHVAALTPGRTVTSIFFGGGTPSLMAPATVAALIERAAARWRLAPDAEITLEANPTSAEAGKFRAFRAAGVNRLSLGVQALDDRALRFLGRRHDRAEALAAIAAAAAAFPRYSFDLIYARPHQTVAAWRAELGAALALAGDHLSLYQLTIEAGTAFAASAASGALAGVGEARAAALYDATQETMAAAGLPAYEISNHARPGAECRHNLTYWRYGEYAGVGPGAHGRLALAAPGGGRRRIALSRTRSPEAWLAAVEARGHGTIAQSEISPAGRIEEMVMMGLRLVAGIRRADFRREIGREPEAVLDPARLARLRDGGFLVLDAAGLRASPAGLRRLDAVLAELIA